MKHHLYVLLIALRILVVVVAFAAIGQFLYATLLLPMLKKQTALHAAVLM